MLEPTPKPKILSTLSRTELALVRESIRQAILAASRQERDYALACRLFAGDLAGVSSGDAPGGGLERAVARAILDAWLHGIATPLDVGGAYADLAFELRRRESHG